MLGIVQGLTEFLPISSTGHLRIVPAFFGWEDPGAAFTAVTQLGTMAAVLLYFRADLSSIAVAWARSVREPALRRTQDARLGWYIALGTIPIAIFGVAFHNQIENGARDLYLIGIMLIVFGADPGRRRGGRPPGARASRASPRATALSSASRRRSRSCRASRARARRSRPACSSVSSGPPPRATRSCCPFRRWC